jgi:hypothetical protein
MDQQDASGVSVENHSQGLTCDECRRLVPLRLTHPTYFPRGRIGKLHCQLGKSMSPVEPDVPMPGPGRTSSIFRELP